VLGVMKDGRRTGSGGGSITTGGGAQAKRQNLKAVCHCHGTLAMLRATRAACLAAPYVSTNGQRTAYVVDITA
jgi:hypothetical protein